MRRKLALYKCKEAIQPQLTLCVVLLLSAPSL